MAKFPVLETSEFLAFIADNSGLGIHRAGYNGVASLIPKRSPNNIFVPTYAGMNYETINLTGLTPYVEKTGMKFEPRREPMHVEHADDKQVVLVQPETSHAHVSARITFSVEEPNYLHQKIELIPHRRFHPDGESCSLSSLWASYMHMPANRNIYMKTEQAESDHKGWYALTKEGHSSRDLFVQGLPDNPDFTVADHLNQPADGGSLEIGAPDLSATLEQGLPFYYGLYHKLVFLMMFKQAEQFRLAYSPCGGGQEPAWSPAWDYVLRMEDVEVETTYTWDLCLCVKPFDSRSDIMEEVRGYRAK